MHGLRADFQRFFESLPGLFLVLSSELKIVAASDAYLAAVRSSRENLIGRPFFDLFMTETEESNAALARAVKESFEKVLRDGVPDVMSVQKQIVPGKKLGGADFEVRYWKSVNVPLLSSDGGVEYIIRHVEDVTQQVKWDQESGNTDRERDIFFKHSFDIFAIVGSDGYFKRLNPAAEKLLGYSEEELCSVPLTEFMHPEDVAKTRKGIQTLATGSSTIASVNRYRCRDGAYRWFSWNTVPMGNVFFSVGRDITNQVEIEARVQELNRELASKNEDLEGRIKERLAELQRSEAQVQQLQKMDAIGRLAGGVAHDFNNILGAITLYCDLLNESADDPAAVREQVQDIRGVAERAAALTRQLLVFSRKQFLQLQTVSLNSLIQQLEKMLTRLIGEDIRIITKLGAGLRLVSVDPSQIEQVILNLVVNARDAMPGGGTMTIETSNIDLDETFTSTHLSVNPGPYVLLSVTDDGCGMDAAAMKQIFDPFFTTKEVGKGTGLGLATTYGIVKQCRGTIWVYSEPGRGTVFKIYLPVAEKRAEDTEPVPSPAPVSKGSETVLLVEDDEKLRRGFETMLAKSGYRVLATANAGEALELCDRYEEKIHLLLTDVVMPGLSGFELAKRLVLMRPEMKILYMSGYTDDALENSGIKDLGQLPFLQKPFDTRALIQKVQDVLAGRSS